jgi:hypothetical protein
MEFLWLLYAGVGRVIAWRFLRIKQHLNRVGIHEHNITKRLKSFALCYSQLLLLADFSLPYGFLRLEFSTASQQQLGEGGEGGFALCLFTFKTAILISLVLVYFILKRGRKYFVSILFLNICRVELVLI